MLFHLLYTGFWNAFGSTVELSPGHICWVAARQVSFEVIGEDVQWTGGDVTKSNCVFVWAKDPVKGHPPHFGWLLLEAKKNGAKVVVIDPRFSTTASKADLWLPIRPGTDAALVLTMLREIIITEKFDHDFVCRWTNGPFLVREDTGMILRESDMEGDGDSLTPMVWDRRGDRFSPCDREGIDPAIEGTYTFNGITCKPAFQLLREQVEPWTIDKGSEVTWVPPERIRVAIRLYTENGPGSSLIRGEKIEPGINCSGTVHALDILMAITGNLEVPGGNLFIPRLGHRPWYTFMPENPPPEPPPEDQLAPGKFNFYKLTGPFSPTFQIIKTILSGKPFPLKAGWIMQSNPILAFEGAEETYDALKALDFLVVTDRFMTPTAELADIVLPASTEYEHNRLVESGPSELTYSCPILLARPKVIEPRGECKHDLEILLDLRERLGVKKEAFMPFDRVEEFLDWQLEPLGMDFATFAKQVYHTAPVEYERYKKGALRLDGKPGFGTTSGKVHIYSERLKIEGGWGPLPGYKEPPSSPVSTPEQAKEYPLILIAGCRSHSYFHTEYRQVPRLRELQPYPRVDIHPETAIEYGIGEGDWVWIESPHGRVRQKARLTKRVQQQMISADHGWWYPEKEGPLHGCFDSNINVLCSNDGPYDPATSGTLITGYLVKIYRAEGPPEGILDVKEDPATALNRQQ
jgi:anaerobic selenocysteine-containing dehydrogenase